MQIEHGQLNKDQTVWYRYENSTAPASGPFKVLDFYNNHEGRNVRLSGNGDVRNVCLASDDDYGEPLFYDAEP